MLWLGCCASLTAAQVVVVDGRAGYGKSTVVSEVAASLEAEGWFVAVARMDTDQSMSTSRDLGHAMGLSESPSVLLDGVSAGLSALLVVDQLDAVSLFSGPECRTTSRLCMKPSTRSGGAAMSRFCWLFAQSTLKGIRVCAR